MLTLGSHQLNSRLLLGTALYSSPELMCESIRASGAEMVTISLRRQNPTEKAGAQFWDLVKSLDVKLLPNTAGCRTVKEAITTARMARELFGTNLIKLEVIGDDYNLQPDPLGLVEAAQALVADGFEVLPYSTEDLVIAQRLLEAGCKVVMPWGAPIGSAQGLINEFGLRTLRARLPGTTLVVDAGLGRPSEAARAMEMGFDAVLVNSAIALSRNPIKMAAAFAEAVRAGRNAYEAGPMTPREMAAPSTPTLGTPFWHTEMGGRADGRLDGGKHD